MSPVDIRALARRARESGDPAPLMDALPCACFLGLSVARADGSTVPPGAAASTVAAPDAGPPPGASTPGARQLLARLAYAPHLVGNSFIPALHGGAVASLLEAAAFFQLLWEVDEGASPRIIGITVDYLRTAQTVDTLARADITRQGRRIATVHAEAWQEDPARPVATARAHFLLGA